MRMLPDTDVRVCAIGKGLFAREKIPRETVILEIDGELRTAWEDMRNSPEGYDNSIRFSEMLFIDTTGTKCRYINHSCKPNARIAERDDILVLESIRTIETDQEILFDYSTVLSNDDDWEMACLCGEDNCRKTIRAFISLPEELKQRYIKEKIVPQYILDLDEEHIKTGTDLLHS